ncbi:hypothetical protein BD289DRAFT_432528 [Coniella lustricola]|uniref:Extracellular membrane protein CFEM domain-containing protein n=1 Tax=Coniella lustricola TaxID=2025994 RepID=A0A2T3A9P9_9PEZI|nr:hypothetical protein BD289DRAFT_432528 [Coniella lustricola]
MITTMASRILLALLATPVLGSDPFAHELFHKRDYVNDVCSPNITVTSDTVIPPCIEVVSIQEACSANDTDYSAQAECMCTSSYFNDWTGCQDCLYYHGQRTERDEAFYNSVASVASQSLCDYLSSTAAPTPTTDFAGYFSVIAATLPPPTTGATISSDQAPSATAVSLYFTETGHQGLAVTASATTASGSTNTEASTSSTSSSNSSTRTSSSDSSSTSTASSGAASSSSSGSGAAPTKAAGGLLLGLGLAVMAGL